MIGAGRPLRFLALLLGGWVAARLFMLWPVALETIAPVIQAVTGESPLAASTVATPQWSAALRPKYNVRMAIRSSPVMPAVWRPSPTIQSSPVSSERISIPQTAPPPPDAPVGRPAPRSGKAWSVSAWLVARADGGNALAPSGMLGGSQAGVRAIWRPVDDLPVGVFARVSRSLRMTGAEAAIGVEAQPVRAVPIRIALEQRFKLEAGAAEGTTLSVIGGVSDVPLFRGVQLDGYGQAGMVGLRRRAGFIDGAARIAAPVASLGETDILLGAGIWGAAQPGLSRLDLGPRAELRLPVARQRVRLGVEWRERIAGNAKPGSGPSVSLGADF